MDDEHTLKVKFPESILRKPMVPGPNSWALSQQQHKQDQHANGLSNGTKAVKKDKYENKPMPPPPPPDSPSPDARLQPKAYIQPAVPLVTPLPATKTPQKRSVTEPVVPKPLFGSRKISVTELRRKYSNSKSKAIATEAPEEATRQSTPKPPAGAEDSGAPVQWLGTQSVEGVVRDTTPVPVPAKSTDNPFLITYESPLQEKPEHARPTQSTPLPTRRYLRENGIPTPKLAETFDQAKHEARGHAQNEGMRPLASKEHIQASAMLYPSRVGTYANTGEVAWVEANGLHRVESCVGVIENAGSGNSNGNTTCTNSSEFPSQPSTTQDSSTGGLLPSVVYTPSDYGGVWENDPAVGYSLPPFSPMPKGHPAASNSGSAPQGSVPDVFRGSNPNFDRFSQYQNSFPSANSWASESQSNSLGSNIPHLSALLPPRWPHHHSMNAVPSPPANQHDFQRAGSVSVALTQIELTVHHHIDTAFSSLSRLIGDKHDRMMDQTLHRLESLEDTVSKGFRAVKGEIKDVRKEFGKLQGLLIDESKSSNHIVGLVKMLEGKLDAFQAQVEQHAAEVKHTIAEQSTTELHHQQRSISHRRTESAHGALGRDEQRQHYQSGASTSTNSARQSETSSRRNRSNTTGSQSAGHMSDDRSTRKETYAEVGAPKEAVPDLRDHPAFTGIHRGHNQALQHSQTGLPNSMHSLPFETPSLSDGRWYQQAYGQGRKS